MTPGAPSFRACGRRALLVEYPDEASTQAVLAEALRRRGQGWLPELDDLVPAARTILFDGVDHPDRLAAELTSWRPAAVAAPDGPVVEVPVTYDGPDLDLVATHCGLTPSEVVAAHTAVTHRVAFCGFAPGFAYLAGGALGRPVPRRAQPRPAVPAGAVALAGDMTGVYPRSSPGGWQLIGRTDLVVWDPHRDPPALLAPGTQVRFRAR